MFSVFGFPTPHALPPAIRNRPVAHRGGLTCSVGSRFFAVLLWPSCCGGSAVPAPAPVPLSWLSVCRPSVAVLPSRSAPLPCPNQTRACVLEDTLTFPQSDLPPIRCREGRHSPCPVLPNPKRMTGKAKKVALRCRLNESSTYIAPSAVANEPRKPT